MKAFDWVIVGGLAFVAYSLYKSKNVDAIPDINALNPQNVGYATQYAQPESTTTPQQSAIDNQSFSIPMQTSLTQNGKVIDTIKYNVVSSTKSYGTSLGSKAISSGIAIQAPGTNAQTTMSKGFAALAKSYGVI